MRDGHAAQLAGAQFNRVSRVQLLALGMSDAAIKRRVASRRLVAVEQGVFAFAPVLEHDQWGRWMGATLTKPGSVLSHVSAAVAWELLSRHRDFETITRPGLGGPRRHGGILVFRSQTLDGDCDRLRAIPITTVPRTLLDLAATGTSDRALARAVREGVRLGHTSIEEIAGRLGAYVGRRGSKRLAVTIARYAGLPLERARSGAEVRALELLRDAGLPLPRLNTRVAGEEADLSWPRARLIIEIDGGPFHLDVGADACKQRRWESAGWTVRRIDADRVHDDPDQLLALVRSAALAH
jgi:very-short-patch-repair endonuclease